MGLIFQPIYLPDYTKPRRHAQTGRNAKKIRKMRKWKEMCLARCVWLDNEGGSEMATAKIGVDTAESKTWGICTRISATSNACFELADTKGPGGLMKLLGGLGLLAKRGLANLAQNPLWQSWQMLPNVARH